tara:strand:- start:1817 stop:2575 length:759 start_codon:yes stop_codon:yes gene_type:complete
MAAVTSAVVGIAGAGMSIAQGFQSKKAARQAAKAAADSLEQAKRKIEIRRMEQLQVPLESYQLEQQALVAGQQQAIEGLRESGQRAVQGGLPGLQAQVQAGAEGIRQDQAQAIYDRDKLIVDEQKTADNALASLDLQTAQGAQMAAAQAEERAGAQFTSGVQGLGGVAQSLYADSKLYKTVDPAAAPAAAAAGPAQVAPFAVSNGVGNTASVFAPQAGVQPLGNFNQQLPGINDPIQQFGIQPYDFSGIRFN